MDWKKVKEELAKSGRKVDEEGWDSVWGKMHLNYMASVVEDLVEAVAKLEEKVSKLEGGEK